MKRFIFHQKRDNKLLGFRHSIKMEYQKIVNVLDTASDKVPRFITENGYEFINLDKHTVLTNK